MVFGVAAAVVIGPSMVCRQLVGREWFQLGVAIRWRLRDIAIPNGSPSARRQAQHWSASYTRLGAPVYSSSRVPPQSPLRTVFLVGSHRSHTPLAHEMWADTQTHSTNNTLNQQYTQYCHLIHNTHNVVTYSTIHRTIKPPLRALGITDQTPLWRMT